MNDPKVKVNKLENDLRREDKKKDKKTDERAENIVFEQGDDRSKSPKP